jgi:GDP-4-dehydro-6-deoxy-D-mannose reductase
MKKKILITGATGFVGSHMADYILENFPNYEIYASKRYHLSRLDKIEHVYEKIRWIDCDVTDPIATEKMIRFVKPYRIFHFAAESFVSPSWDHPHRYMSVNYNGTLNILEAMKKIKSRAKILIPGSGEEYGLLDKKDMPITEKTLINPVNPYAVSKVAQDYISYVYYKSFGVRAIRVRTFNHEGPRRENVFGISSYAFQIAKIEKSKNKKTKILVGHLKDKRNFTHVLDVVKAYWLATELCEVGKLYLIGNYSSKSIYTFEQALVKLKNYSMIKNLKHKIHRPFVRPTSVPFLITQKTEFENLTGWKPKISFEQILLDTLNFWREKLGTT